LLLDKSPPFAAVNESSASALLPPVELLLNHFVEEPGTDVMILKIFSLKSFAKKLAFLS
jgi:hypothetical protein